MNINKRYDILAHTSSQLNRGDKTCLFIFKYLKYSFYLIYLFCSSHAISGELNSNELINLAPVLNRDDLKTNSIKIVGKFNEQNNVNLMFYAVFYDSSHCDACIIDDGDHTPLLLFRDGRIYMLDTVNCTLMSSDDYYMDLELKSNDEQNKVEFDLMFSKSLNKLGINNININLNQCVHKDGLIVSSSSINNSMYRLTCTNKKGTNITFHINPALPCPYTMLELTPAGTPVPALRFSKIEKSKIKLSDRPRFPQFAKIADNFTLIDLSKNDVLNNISSMAFVSQACLGRRAMFDPTMRNSYELTFNRKIDWVNSKEKYIKTSINLKNLFSEEVDFFKK